MSQHHGHDHHHGATNYSRAFAIGTALNIGIVMLEVVYGFLANSLALLADAGHNLGDVLGLLIAWGATLLVQRPPTRRRTYGLRRSSILAALLNAILLLFAMGAIAWEAVHRLSNPSSIAEGEVIAVAAVAILINGTTAFLFVSGRKQDLNIRGAFLHMLTDAFVSLGVVLAGIAILMTGWLWFDPVVSLIIVAVILAGTWQLLQDAVNLALDAVPEGIEPLAVHTYLAELPGVEQVHDLHIWAISTTETALTVHLVMPTGHSGDEFLTRVCKGLHDQFGIEHSTLQIERGDPQHPCTLAPESII
jgi:cobalt-zinc-cadmium efflux system protein